MYSNNSTYVGEVLGTGVGRSVGGFVGVVVGCTHMRKRKNVSSASIVVEYMITPKKLLTLEERVGDAEGVSMGAADGAEETVGAVDDVGEADGD